MEWLDDPNAITQLGIGGVFVLLLLKAIPEFITAMRPTTKADDSSMIFTEKTHDKACELASLRMEKYFQRHFTKLKDELFAELRKLQRGNGGKDDDI